MKKHLFLFTISPVQSFIAQARKTQDLFAGSRILSDIMTQSINSLTNAEVIYPKLTGDSATHRVLALVEAEDIKQYAENLTTKVWKFILDEIYKEVLNRCDKNNIKEICEKQIKSFFKFYWAAEKYDENKHFEIYKRVEKKLGAIKNARQFKPLEEESGRKDALNGEYNVVFYKKKEKETKDKLIKSKIFNKNFIPTKESPSIIQEGEGLSAINFIKRLYKKEEVEKFPSTAEVALMEIELNNSEAFEKYKKLFNEKEFPTILINHFHKIGLKDFQTNFNNNFDYQYFFPENLTKKEFPNEYQLKWIRKWHSKFINHLIKKRYYAIIVFDGDNMGKWLSGEYVEAGRDFHETLSKALGDFSQKAKNYLKEPYGRAVYAGGDDFLGFVNLDYLFEVLNSLRVMFKTYVNNKIQQEYIDKLKRTIKELTFSAGICVAHYKYPLSIVLHRAYEMQERAKNYKDKNAFAINVIRRSGVEENFVLPFGNLVEENNEDRFSNLQIFSKINEYLESDEKGKSKFSTNFIVNIQREFENLKDENGVLTVDRDLLDAELKRLIERSADKTITSKNDVENFYDLVRSLLLENNMKNWFSILNIIDFMIRKTTR